MNTPTPNRAMLRTANQPTICRRRVCHPPFGCDLPFTGLAVADLLSR